MTEAKTGEWTRNTARLIDQQRKHVGDLCSWADYEVRAVSGEGGFLDHAIGALGFEGQDFGMRDTQAVSCDVCGGLFVERLGVMRNHRLRCGWDS